MGALALAVTTPFARVFEQQRYTFGGAYLAGQMTFRGCTVACTITYKSVAGTDPCLPECSGHGDSLSPLRPQVQLVACSATASYRLREELCRLWQVCGGGPSRERPWTASLGVCFCRRTFTLYIVRYDHIRAIFTIYIVTQGRFSLYILL